MKLMCISSGTPGKTEDSFGNKGVFVPKIHVGNYYNKVDEWTDNGELYYELSEVPPSSKGIYYGYNSKLFAVPSDIDEVIISITKEEVAH